MTVSSRLTVTSAVIVRRISRYAMNGIRVSTMTLLGIRMKIQLASIFVVASFATAGGQDMPASLDRYLRETIKLTPAELSAAKSGQAVARLIPTENQRDV